MQRNIKPLVAFRNYSRPLWKPASQHGFDMSSLSRAVVKRRSSECHRALVIRTDVCLWRWVQWRTDSTAAFPHSSLLSTDINVCNCNVPKTTNPVNSGSDLLLPGSPEPPAMIHTNDTNDDVYLVSSYFCLMFTVYGPFKIRQNSHSTPI